MLEFVFIDKQVVETYREIGGLKLLCMGSDQTEMSQHRVKEIIKDEMLNFKGWFWVEVSDAIEYFFKKTNGLPIPNIYATEILGQEVEFIDDDARYMRKIGVDDTLYKKVIYGFRDKESYDKVMTEIKGHIDFMNRINQFGQSFAKYPRDVNKAIFIIENTYNLHYEDGFNELLPEWYELLLQSIDILKNSNLQDGTIKQYIETSQHLLQEMPVLELGVI